MRQRTLKLILAPADEILDATCARREGESVANPGSKLDMTRRDFVKTVGIGIGALQTAAIGAGMLGLTGCGSSPVDPPAPQVVSWPIAKQVYTTAQQQVCPVALSPRSDSFTRAMSLSMRNTGTAPGPWAVRCSTSCARIWRRLTRVRPTRRGCCTTSPCPTFISPTRSRRRSPSISAGARPMVPFERRVVGLLADPAVHAAGARRRRPDHQRLAQSRALRFRPVAGGRLQQHAVQRAALVPRHHRRQSHHAQLGRASGRLQHRLPEALLRRRLQP